MAYPPQDRLIRKEVALTTIREITPPRNLIGTSIAPFLSVASDDVIFDYMKGLAEGLAPARAEDAESELAQKDTVYGGTGRASLVDWAIKDHYTASDVQRFREVLALQARLGVNSVNLPLTVGNQSEDLRSKYAREDASRIRKLQNRHEWLVMTALSTGGIAYNDGKIIFTVDFGRPANQHDEVPPGGLWTLNTSDPIGDILSMQEFMLDTYGVRITRAITSQKVLRSMTNSDRFLVRAGVPVVGGTPSIPIDPNYLVGPLTPTAVQTVVENATGLSFQPYDSVYRTKPIGSTTFTNNRYFPQNKIVFLPDAADVAELEEGQGIGFAKTLTSPHPEGNWQPGYYEWEQDTKDPWGVDRGNGIKMFPIFPHMQLTFTMVVIP